MIHSSCNKLIIDLPSMIVEAVEMQKSKLDANALLLGVVKI